MLKILEKEDKSEDAHFVTKKQHVRLWGRGDNEQYSYWRWPGRSRTPATPRNPNNDDTRSGRLAATTGSHAAAGRASRVRGTGVAGWDTSGATHAAISSGRLTQEADVSCQTLV